MKWSLTASTRAAAIGIVIVVLCGVSSVSAQSMPGYRAPDKPKAAEVSVSAKAAQGKAPLSKLYGHLKTDPAKVKRLPPIDPREKLKDLQEKMVRIGVVRPLEAPFDPLTDSAIYSVREGDVRVGAVVSEGALYTRVHFKGMSLPDGARVFVYSASNPDEYYGPYEGRGPSDNGTFWTPPLSGDAVVVEYISPPGTKSNAPFKVFEVSHIYKDIFSPNDPAGSCNLDVTSQWLEVAKATAMLQFTTAQGEALCTGTLMNDVDPSTAHHVLTANHCISTESEAQSVKVYWHYNSGEAPPGGAANTTLGANLLSTGTASDFTLLRLTGTLPSGLFFSGWDASPVSVSTPVTGIHHPNGSHKRISFGATNSTCGAGLPGPCGNFTGVTWNPNGGTTEQGSSGSGIWTGTPDNPKLVGTLTGGFASCANSTGSDFYGRFSVTYPSVSAFLIGSCVSSISPTSQNFPGSGGPGTITVTAPAGCNWTAVATESFITITGGSNGDGPGTVNFSVAANPNGAPRSAVIAVGAQVFTINQARKSDGGCATTSINLNQTIDGNLQPNCPFGNGSYVDAYTFNATAGQQVVINMSSAAFDTYLYLLNTDGSILTLNDDNGGGTNSRIPSGTGVLTLLNTGTYTILARSYDPAVTGQYRLMLRTPRTLTIASQDPNSGISVSVSPTDANGVSGSGTTQFTRTYAPDVTTTLTALTGTAPNGNIFLKWQKDGVDYSTSQGTSVTMDVDHTMTAVYGPIPTFVLTVLSSNPAMNVPITVTPNDNSNSGNGSTPFTRTYNRFTQVTLTAPISASGNYFQKWQENGNDLTTVRTINVNMNPNRTLTAVYVTLPPTPTPTPTPTPSGPGQAVTYQIDPAHTGSQYDTTIPPLAQRWSRDLGNTVSYPLIAGGKVFVTTVTGLHALDATNGATVWATGDIGTSPAAAYDAGRVFVINRNGLLRAFDASSGTQVWTRQLSGQAFSSPPTATGGTVYVAGYPTMHAVNEQDGSIKWSTLNAGGDNSSPVVSANAVFGAYACNNVWALSPTTGSVLWHHTSSCFGGGGRTAVLFGGRLYARDNALSNATLDAGTGTQVDEFLAGPAPAFNGSTGYFLNGSSLEARDVTSGALKWSFAGDGTLSSAPIVVNGYVYIGSMSGKLYAVNESTGTNVWTGTVGASVNRPDEQSLSAPAGLAAGEGLIVVPASNLLVAYQSTPRLLTDSNNRAIAVDSVNFVRDPFSVASLHNFSSDQRTRIMIFTSNLGLSQPTADLSVLAGNIPLTVEAVGTLAGMPDISYIVVKLDPALTGNVQVSVIFRGVTTNAGVISIGP